ncbi:archaetidylserine decarboxylase [Celerinatantimonas sp. YJH-8]|uniref:archaetidylserine decarboxylase n=1 Tax=Celerinatantimonas sp. YJH-8 TaxID=3228714 RepID=UPI0038C8D7BE
MLDKLQIAFQYILPKRALSRLVGYLAAAQAKELTQFVIRQFIRYYKVDMSEALSSDPSSFKTFNEFFTRELKPGARPIVEGEHTLAHPADGRVSQKGSIRFDRIIQAKGHDYSVKDLLGGRDTLAKEFDDGTFTTIYLSPRDYHRVHMPIDGTLREMIHVPGELFSVNPLTAQYVPELFARNERVVAIFDTAVGPMAMVLVGATIVASIETVWAGTIAPAGGQISQWHYQQQPPVTLKKGDEMGRFKLGSTVILLFGHDAIQLDKSVRSGEITRMGSLYATPKIKAAETDPAPEPNDSDSDSDSES